MWSALNHKQLYLLVSVLSLAMVGIALDGGLFGQSGMWYTHWQHALFRGLCHQDPSRSFWLMGTPMAVCSRCFGIYSSFALSWLLFPMVKDSLGAPFRHRKKILAIIVLLNIVDVIGDMSGLWHNTLVSRFFLGAAIGISAALVLAYEFTNETQHQLNGIDYGTNRTI